MTRNREHRLSGFSGQAVFFFDLERDTSAQRIHGLVFLIPLLKLGIVHIFEGVQILVGVKAAVGNPIIATAMLEQWSDTRS